MSADPRLVLARTLPLPVALLGACTLAGCGLGAGRAPTAVQLVVTRDFGARELASRVPLRVRGQETVMSLLIRNHSVQTRYGGGFVQSIDALAGGSEGGRPVDWFYYVNGVEAPQGAAATNVHPGDHVWWDRHDWSQTDHIPAVVGAFPEPFRDGIEGKRFPVRVECASVAGAACRRVTARLRGAGVPAAVAAAGAGGAQTLRVLVGPWQAIFRDTVAGAIARGPRASGVYARFEANGAALALLDADGAARARLGAGGGLIAATRYAEDAPVWVVTGTDERGVELASLDFDARSLEHRFALAVSAAGAHALPLAP